MTHASGPFSHVSANSAHFAKILFCKKSSVVCWKSLRNILYTLAPPSITIKNILETFRNSILHSPWIYMFFLNTPDPLIHIYSFAYMCMHTHNLRSVYSEPNSQIIRKTGQLFQIHTLVHPKIDTTQTEVYFACSPYLFSHEIPI